MVFGSVERYMFIFHSIILQQHAIILRYLPIAWCLLELSCFYIVLILFPPGCQNIFHPGIFLCAVACVNLNPIWLGLEMQLHIAVPIFLIIISKLSTRYSSFSAKTTYAAEAYMDEEYVRMVLQLVSISILCGIYWLPNVIGIQISIYDKIEPIT